MDRPGVTNVELAFWRAIAVFRAAALVYAVVLVVRAGGYSQPAVSWAVLGVMTVWTAVTVVAYPGGRHLLAADLAVTAGCLLATSYAQSEQELASGAMPVTGIWVAAPVLAFAVHGGRRAAAAAGIALSAADVWLRAASGLDLADVPVNGAVLMLLSGVVVGHVAQLAKDAEVQLQRAAEIEAAGRERERLARGIHDSVLQVLALVQRRGAEIGGEAAELGRLAGEQEAALRALVQAPSPAAMAPDHTSGQMDLRELLRPYGTARITVSVPGTPLLLPAATAREVGAAVGAALDNVTRHCPDGAQAWIFAEEDREVITVSVRDDGPGIADGRLAEAEAAGRMGVARSIRGRVADCGGSVTITSSQSGTEVELAVPVRRSRA